jgi:hypothetical protein
LVFAIRNLPDKAFLTVLGLSMHQENNKVIKRPNFCLRINIRHTVRRKTREFYEDDQFIDNSNL